MKRVFLIAGSLLLGCGYSNTQIPTDAPTPEMGGPNQSAGTSLDFSSVKAQFFQPYCLRCHSTTGGNKAGINLETYTNVRSVIVKVQNAVNGGVMPPSGSLPSAAVAFLNQWLQAGAPETSSTNPQPTPGPDPVPGPTPDPCPNKRHGDCDED